MDKKLVLEWFKFAESDFDTIWILYVKCVRAKISRLTKFPTNVRL